MRSPIQSFLVRLRGSWLRCCFLLMVLFCCGCHFESPAMIDGSFSKVSVNAEWAGRPPTAVDSFGYVYGSRIDFLADVLLLAYGERPSRRSGPVVCHERRLTTSQARVLVDTGTDFFLPDLEILDPEPARILGSSSGILNLGALRSLDPVAAALLAGKRDALVVNGLTCLSAGAAGGLARSEGPLKLDGLSQLEPGVAAALAEHVGQLSLNGLQSLSPTDAAALAAHRGDLCLNGLQMISDEVAEALQNLAYGLHMNGLVEISVPAAAALSHHRGWCLGVNGLRPERVSSGAFALLSRHHRARGFQITEYPLRQDTYR